MRYFKIAIAILKCSALRGGGKAVTTRSFAQSFISSAQALYDDAQTVRKDADSLNAIFGISTDMNKRDLKTLTDIQKTSEMQGELLTDLLGAGSLRRCIRKNKGNTFG